MKETILQAIKQRYAVQPEKIEELGGGFYGRVFFVTLPCEPFIIAAKLYLFSGLATKEAVQIQLLSRYSSLRMPTIYHVLERNVSGLSYDVVLMEYLNGVNAGFLDVAKISQTVRETICTEIVENLIAVHDTVNPNGFGPLNATDYCKTWQEYYYPIACSIVDKAQKLYQKNQLSDTVLSVFKKSIQSFFEIFNIPITKASLIHGDYNTWNILLSEDLQHAAAVIDPFGCCWADSEYDLYQLDNANGKSYELLEKYAAIKPLSANFAQKRCFYELYNEVNHYYDSGVTVSQAAVEVFAQKLNDFLVY